MIYFVSYSFAVCRFHNFLKKYLFWKRKNWNSDTFAETFIELGLHCLWCISEVSSEKRLLTISNPLQRKEKRLKNNNLKGLQTTQRHIWFIPNYIIRWIFFNLADNICIIFSDGGWMKLREIAIVRVPLCFYSPLSHYTFHSEAFEDRHGDADGDIFFRDFIRRAVFEKSAKGCTLTSWAPRALSLRTL